MRLAFIKLRYGRVRLRGKVNLETLICVFPLKTLDTHYQSLIELCVVSCYSD